MKLTRNLPLLLHGKPIRCDVETYSRGGTDSPTLDIFIFSGKRYVPYAAKRIGIEWTASAILHMLYDPELFNDLVYKDNPFLSLIPKKDDFIGSYIPIDYRKPLGDK
jgi:hypothetical protein